MFTRGVDVVVVSRQAGLLELLRLAQVNHPKRHANFHVERPHARDHRLDVAQTSLAPPHVPPCGAHAESRAPVRLRNPRGLEDGFHR